ncbi:MAG: Maf family protein, partial [Planctomycetales bacterium]
GICLWPRPENEPLIRVAETVLQMEQLTDDQLQEYLASGLWEGKAGAFGYQDRAGWLTIISGSESNVVGLPLETLAEMLTELGGRIPEIHGFPPDFPSNIHLFDD